MGFNKWDKVNTLNAYLMGKAEGFEKENKNLKCCGNCHWYQKDCYPELAYNVCDRWKFDEMTENMRVVKWEEKRS